ncbi:hypothetical protein EKG38_09840 [Shewanella canadensis]|uniref:Tetrachloroethene dehalogenase n=1 Tax=Shewanella canadensis TaxID=271096 RepID=A0A3S0KAJ2_9GAMM|nr:hypothetical protein [Shewanella canadensis]RTR39209.1 hypothetical protein EKG38_09840 [Shewanella canadensis]
MQLLQWFLMGIMFTLGSIGVAYLSTKVKMPWYGWSTVIIGSILVLFGIGWSGASFLEGVAQSGAMALMLMSMPGVLMVVLAYRYFATQIVSKS